MRTCKYKYPDGSLCGLDVKRIRYQSGTLESYRNYRKREACREHNAAYKIQKKLKTYELHNCEICGDVIPIVFEDDGKPESKHNYSRKKTCTKNECISELKSRSAKLRWGRNKEEILKPEWFDVSQRWLCGRLING